jgi:hypothetical protein
MKPVYELVKTTDKHAPKHPREMDSRGGLHVLIVVAHGISSAIATYMVFRCNVSRANQQATIPYALPTPDIEWDREVERYRAGVPWAEDGEYFGNVWNPYALIFAFEWITAAFAICNLKPMLRDAQDYSCIWLGVGFILMVIWHCLNYQSISLFMSLVLFWSYMVTWFICGYFDEKQVLNKAHPPLPPTVLPVVHKKEPVAVPDPAPEPSSGSGSFFLVTTDTMLDGRLWYG